MSKPKHEEVARELKTTMERAGGLVRLSKPDPVGKDVSEHFGAKLTTMRMRRAISQADLALKTRVSRSVIANIEAGRSRVSLDLALRLAEGLGCLIIINPNLEGESVIGFQYEEGEV